MTGFDYIRDPSAIYAESFRQVEMVARLDRLPAALHGVATRLVHSCGMPDLVDDLDYSDNVVAAGQHALAGGNVIFCDCEMVAAGITRRFLPAGNPVVVTLNDERTAPLAKALKTTRSAAAVDLWDDRLAGAVVAIGNAPTALFRLLERIADGGPRPAAILGFPVGFVGAAESKQALAGAGPGLEFIALRGRRGGSALAAAAVNALCIAAGANG